MAKGRIGLDIGSTAVRAVELTGGDNPTVLHAAQVGLPAGAVENGEVRDPSAVAEGPPRAVAAGRVQAASTSTWASGTSASSSVRSRCRTCPEKELRASLGFQVQEFIPMPVDDAVLDYDPIEEFEQEGRKMLRMLLVAAQRGMVDQMVAAALDAKLEPMGLDLIPFAMVRAVGTSDRRHGPRGRRRRGGRSTSGAHVTNIVVHARGTTRFVRILPSGGRDITAGRRAGPRGRGRRRRAVEARRGRRGPRGRSRIPRQVHQLAIQRATSFVDEIRSSLEFYTAQAQGPRIERVVVSGGGSKLDGFLDLLRQRIPVEIEAGRGVRACAPQPAALR